MLKAKLPVYALRAYDSIEEKDGYVLVHTPFNTYILDCKELLGDYAARRLSLSCMDLPYKLYPLKDMFSTLSQVVNSKRRHFIDTNGKLWNYKPQKFYRVQYTKVFSASRTWNGYNFLMTKLPVHFVTDIVPNYIGYIQVGAAYYLYDYSDEPKPATRKKI